MNRRDFLLGLVGGAGGVTGVSTVTGVDLDLGLDLGSDVADTVGSAPMEGDSFTFGPGFESIAWVNSDELKISWKPDHDMDGFGISHAYGDPFEDDLVLEEAPRFDGERVVPLVEAITDANTRFPTREFHLNAFAGSFGHMNIVEEHLGSVSFTIPEEIAPAGSFSE